MISIKNLLGLSLIFIFSSCFINRQRQVLFTELKDAHEADKNVVRVYIDKRGKLYPNNVYIPFQSFFMVGDKLSSYNVEKTGSLENYFANSKTGLKKLAEVYHLPLAGTDSLAIFHQSQDIIQASLVNQIHQLIKESISKTVIVLIHGFNDPNPTGDYQRMRNYIKNYKKINDAVYIEIYWDGLTANQGNPGTSKIWGYAQTNSSFAANTVRKIVNKIDSIAHIRILTHSLGASVATGTLFNTYSKWEITEGQDFYTEMISIEAPKQKDLRLGMITPAIPGVNTFTDFNHRVGTTNMPIEKNNISRIIVGFKETDVAMRKGFFQKSRWLSKVKGAITLGSNAKTDGKEEFIRVLDTMRGLGYNNPESIIRRVDFKAGEFYKNEHGLYFYMQNETALKLFLDYLFDD